MALGTIIVITLYCLANLAYLFALPLHKSKMRLTIEWRQPH